MVYLNLYVVDIRSWQSVAIALATRSIYTHSAIQVGERIFEASGSRRTVGWDDHLIHAKRAKRQIKLNINEAEAIDLLEKYNGMEYDATALKLWILALQDDAKVYCFEVCWLFLSEALLLNLRAPFKLKRYTAKKLIKYSKDLNDGKRG